MKNYPKVLLVCNFNQKSANGITIKNLFKQWPKDKIAVADYSNSIEEIYTSNIEKYYILGNKESKYIFPFNKLLKLKESKDYLLNESPLNKNIDKSNALKVNKSLKSRIKSKISFLQTSLIHTFGLSLIMKKYKVSSEFDKWVTDFNPDIIYASTANIGNMNFLMDIQKNYNKKLVFHVFDDFINSGSSRILPILRGYWINRLNIVYKKLLKYTSFNFVISEFMAEVYTQKYNVQYYAFHNPIDESIWLNPKLNNIEPKSFNNDHFIFFYTGKINYDTAIPLKIFLEAIEVLKKNGTKAQLNIYTQTPYDQACNMLGHLSENTFKGFIDNSKLPELFKEADAFLLPLSFKQKSIKYTKLSIATKTTEYMVSKKPIFLFAPDELAVTKYLLNNKAAFIVSREKNLVESIKTFIDDVKLRTQISENAFKSIQERHLSQSVTSKLLSLFNSKNNDNATNN